MHPVSRATHIVANAMAVRFNRLEQFARILIHVGTLPMAVGRSVPNISADQLLALVTAAAFADRIVDAPSVAAAFPGLPERSGGRSGANSFGQFWNGVMADTRDDRIEVELIKLIGFDRSEQFLARVNINDALSFNFGLPRPSPVAREQVVRITPRAFAQLRKDIASDSPVFAREYLP